MLDIENVLKSRPLNYIEDETEFPISTPNVLITGQNLYLPVESPETESKDLRKRFKYVQKCKEVPWARWRKKHAKAPRERHNMKTKDPMSLAKVRGVVIVHTDDRNKGKWTLDIITDVFPGLEGTVPAVRVKTSKWYFDAAIIST